MTALASPKRKLCSQSLNLSTLTRKALKADLRQRITDELAQRVFYALYPDKNESYGTTCRPPASPAVWPYARPGAELGLPREGEAELHTEGAT